jgi:hypothetical protein
LDYEKNKILFGFLAFFFVVLHFVMLAIYAMPYPILEGAGGRLTKGYVYPIFDQKWNMFAPCPTIDGNLEIKFYFKDGDASNWERPVQDAIDNHAFFRATHHGEIALHESNLCYWIEEDVKQIVGDNRPSSTALSIDDYKKGYSVHMLRYYVKGMARYYHNKEITGAKVRYHYNNVVSNAKGVVALPDLYY